MFYSAAGAASAVAAEGSDSPSASASDSASSVEVSSTFFSVNLIVPASARSFCLSSPFIHCPFRVLTPKRPFFF